VAESVPEAKVIAAFFGKSHFSDGHDGIPEHLRVIFLYSPAAATPDRQGNVY
jgi:hypothetical protein